MRGFLIGLMHMHKLGICHRDLKPENVLMKGSDVKIGDFGSSKFLDFEKHMNTPYAVSRYYRAPELILASRNYDFSIDIWSAGCILFEFLTLQPMFPGETEGLQLLEMMCLLGIPAQDELEKMSRVIEMRTLAILQRVDMSIPVPDLVRVIETNKYYKREDVVQGVDLLKRMLRWFQGDRITAE